MSKTIISQLARRAQCLLLSVSIFTAIIVVLLSLFIPQNIVAQWNIQSPGIEVGDGGYIQIGKNDPNDGSPDNHVLTFGRGNSSHNVGLWSISGSRSNLFIIGHTYNTDTKNYPAYAVGSGCPLSGTSGQEMFVIDPNMNVGIDK